MVKVYRVDYDKAEPVETECQELKLLGQDVDGQTIYESSHFKTPQEAWEQLEKLQFAAMRSALGMMIEAEMQLKCATEMFLRKSQLHVEIKAKYKRPI